MVAQRPPRLRGQARIDQLAEIARNTLSLPRMTAAQQRAVLDSLQARFDATVSGYAKGLAQGRLSIDTFQTLMSREIKQLHLSSALTGSRDSRIALQVGQARAAEQIKYLNGFVADLKSGKLAVDAEPNIRQRARLYQGASNATFEASKVMSRGMPDLGTYPGDGKTACRTNCKCSIEIDEDETDYLIFWRLGASEHCPDCEQLASDWNPRRIPKG